jgi:hypothetical protein
LLNEKYGRIFPFLAGQNVTLNTDIKCSSVAETDKLTEPALPCCIHYYAPPGIFMSEDPDPCL